LCGVSIQGTCFLLQTAQELPGLMALKFKLLFELVNLNFFHRRFPYGRDGLARPEHFLKI
jgi:hypothetical protein